MYYVWCLPTYSARAHPVFWVAKNEKKKKMRTIHGQIRYLFRMYFQSTNFSVLWKTVDLLSAYSACSTYPTIVELDLTIPQNGFRSYFGLQRMNPVLAVKQYARSSADQEEPLPHELRPLPVMALTMSYLLHCIADLCDRPGENLAEWYHFLWDRTRSIRKVNSDMYPIRYWKWTYRNASKLPFKIFLISLTVTYTINDV